MSPGGVSGRLDPVPEQLRRRAGLAAIGGAVAIAAAILVSANSRNAFAGGMSWQAALVASCEGIIAVGSSVWLLGHFQRRLDHAGPLARTMGRAAFGAYILQAPVAVTIAHLAGPLLIAPELKFLVVAPAAVAGSFGLAWLLASVPGIKRIL